MSPNVPHPARRPVRLAASALLATLAVAGIVPARAQTPAEDLDSKWVAICAGAVPGTPLGDRCDEILNAGPGSGDRRSDAALGNNLGNAAAASRSTYEERDDAVVREFGAWSLFVTASRDELERDGDTFETGFEDTTDTVLIGLDRRFGARVVLGLAARASDGETTFDGGAGRLETETRAATLYLTATGAEGRQLFEAYAGLGDSEIDSLRNVDYTLVLDQGLPTESEVTLSGTSTGRTDGAQTFAGAGWSIDFGGGAWTWGPALRADLAEREIDGYSETDDIGLALAYDDQDITSLAASAGLQVQGAVSRGWGVFAPQFRVAAVHEFDDDARTIVARFVGDTGGTDILVNTAEPDRDWIDAGAALTFNFSRGVTAYVDVAARFGHDWLEDRSVAAGLRFRLGGR